MIAAFAGAPSSDSADAADDGREQELQAADAGHEAAQRPQPLDRHLDADQEQQEHDAELGERLDAGAILDGEIAQPREVGGERPEAIGADRDPDQQEAEHRADARAVEQRNDQPGSDQEDEHILEPGFMVHRWRSCPDSARTLSR